MLWSHLDPQLPISDPRPFRELAWNSEHHSWSKYFGELIVLPHGLLNISAGHECCLGSGTETWMDTTSMTSSLSTCTGNRCHRSSLGWASASHLQPRPRNAHAVELKWFWVAERQIQIRKNSGCKAVWGCRPTWSDRQIQAFWNGRPSKSIKFGLHTLSFWRF